MWQIWFFFLEDTYNYLIGCASYGVLDRGHVNDDTIFNLYYDASVNVKSLEKVREFTYTGSIQLYYWWRHRRSDISKYDTWFTCRYLSHLSMSFLRRVKFAEIIEFKCGLINDLWTMKIECKRPLKQLSQT